MSGKCLDRSNFGTTPGTQVYLYHSTGAQNQKWIVNASDRTIRAADSGLCLDGGSPDPRPCDVAPLRGSPLCDYSLSQVTRAKWLVGKLTTAEKIGQLTNGAAGIGRFNIPAYQWWSEALHGVGESPGVHFGGPTPYATSFPQVQRLSWRRGQGDSCICHSRNYFFHYSFSSFFFLFLFFFFFLLCLLVTHTFPSQVCLTGSTFNKTLFRAIGSAISSEARAMNNVNRAGLTFWAPNVNIFRDPVSKRKYVST